MRYRKLGGSGLSVSVLCLGSMTFGDATDMAEAARIVGSARDAGVNFCDTADGYAAGQSETILGELIRRDRHAWVLATKVGSRREAPPRHQGLSRKWIMQAIEASLARLKTDYVDLYYLHRDDHETPLAETIGAVGDVIRSGKARYFGFSNYFGWRIAEIVHLCDQLGVPRPVVAQPYYHALLRVAEVDYLPACAHFGIGVVPYSPLARGVLTGKYRPDAPPPEQSRAARRDARFMEVEYQPQALALAQRIAAHAQSRGMAPGQWAVNWVLNNRLVSAVVCGPRTLEQWEAYRAAVGKPFDAEDEAFLDALVPPGHPAVPGFTDPKHPVAGRRAFTASERG